MLAHSSPDSDRINWRDCEGINDFVWRVPSSGESGTSNKAGGSELSGKLAGDAARKDTTNSSSASRSGEAGATDAQGSGAQTQRGGGAGNSGMNGINAGEGGSNNGSGTSANAATSSGAGLSGPVGAGDLLKLKLALVACASDTPFENRLVGEAEVLVPPVLNAPVVAWYPFYAAPAHDADGGGGNSLPGADEGAQRAAFGRRAGAEVLVSYMIVDPVQWGSNIATQLPSLRPQTLAMAAYDSGVADDEDERRARDLSHRMYVLVCLNVCRVPRRYRMPWCSCVSPAKPLHWFPLQP